MTSDTLAVFNVYPEKGRSRLFFRVRIFKSERALRRYLEASPGRHILGRYGRAMCTNHQILKVRKHRTYMTPEMGEILIPIARLGTEVIGHECTHAAIGWADRLGFNPMLTKVRSRSSAVLTATVDEERFCYGLGQMMRQIVDQAYERKLLPCVSPEK